MREHYEAAIGLAPLRAAQPITQWYRAEATVVEYHLQRIGPALDVAPHNPVIQTEIFL